MPWSASVTVAAVIRDKDRYLVVVNAANADKDWAWLNAVNDGTVQIDGRRLIGFEHVHIIHTGSTAAPVYRSVFALETPPWPSLTVRRKSALGAALRRMFGSRDLQFDLPEFNRRFRVTTNDPDFALVLLSPALQRHIMSKPSVIWRLMNGWLVLVYPGALRFDRAEASIARLRRFAELIPPELDAWQSSASSPRGE